MPGFMEHSYYDRQINMMVLIIIIINRFSIGFKFNRFFIDLSLNTRGLLYNKLQVHSIKTFVWEMLFQREKHITYQAHKIRFIMSTKYIINS